MNEEAKEEGEEARRDHRAAGKDWKSRGSSQERLMLGWSGPAACALGKSVSWEKSVIWSPKC